MEKTSVEITGREAGMLASVEVGLGSVLHALHVPLSGHFLSLNQVFLLTRGALKARSELGASARALPLKVSAVAAVLKSLAPAGKKLTPMLAISAQGLLFSIGTLLFGCNLLGAVVGGALASVWAFAQPLLIYYVIFGKSLFAAMSGVAEKLTEALPALASLDLVVMAGLLVGIKTLLAVLVATLATFLPESAFEKYRDRLLRGGIQKKPRPAAKRQSLVGISKLAARDLLNRWFLGSLALTVLFFFFVESDSSKLIWIALRPVAVGFIVFFLIRWLPVERLGQSFKVAAAWISERR